MAKYNGHRSWNAWNVSLWIHNDESLYRLACEYVKRYKNRFAAARALLKELQGQKTPDGANYNYICIYEALEGIEA